MEEWRYFGKNKELMGGGGYSLRRKGYSFHLEMTILHEIKNGGFWARKLATNLL